VATAGDTDAGPGTHRETSNPRWRPATAIAVMDGRMHDAAQHPSATTRATRRDHVLSDLAPMQRGVARARAVISGARG
jgi:hypothetical protein